MSQITLKPLDDGQKAVEIPVGKTTIGRGPFLGCSDKKVSRNHAVLEVTSKGEVFLTPTHVNPCFYQPTAESPGQILKKDVPHKLENGDSFSLLPRAYRYQLIVEGESSQNKSTDQTDPNKQVGKTNGSVSSDLLNDGPATNEELGDTSNTIVPEKSFNKEESPNVDKNSPNNNSSSNNNKEENTTFSKKIAEIKDNNVHDFPPKGAEESEAPSEKTASSPPNGADQIVPEVDPPSDAAPEDTECKAEEDKEEAEECPKAEQPEEEESSDEGYDDAEEKPAAATSPNKTITAAEEAPTPDAEAASKSKAEEMEQDETSALSPKQKTPEKEPSPVPETPDVEDSNEPSEPVVPEAKPEQVPPLTIRTGRGKKATVVKKPKKEKQQAPKRKSEREEHQSPPKRKGRKKKMSFDDSQEGTSHTPGRTSSRTNRQTRQGLSLEDFIVSDDDEWQSDRSDSKPRRKKGRRKRGDDSGSDWEIEHKKPKKAPTTGPLPKGWSGSESGNEQYGQKKKKGPKGRRKKVQQPEEESNDMISEEEEEEEPRPTSSGEVKGDRIPCTYGKKCYRRSTNHKDQFSHPGDSDYTSESEQQQPTPKNTPAAVSESEEEEEEDEEDEAPKKECPYGANCFRKNAQHKKDFKHTKKVRPQREAAKQADKKARGSRNSDEVDSYDLNESFLNDDSADEYKPLDSGSDYESGEKLKKLAKVRGGKRGRGKRL